MKLTLPDALQIARQASNAVDVSADMLQWVSKKTPMILPHAVRHLENCRRELCGAQQDVRLLLATQAG